MVDQIIKEFLSRIGREGGKKSKRRLTSAQARKMVAIRESKRALKPTQS